MADEIVGGQDPTPTHSNGFGPAESADETRQAQHTVETPPDEGTGR